MSGAAQPARTLTVVYDAECRLCLATTDKLRRLRTRSTLVFVPLQALVSSEVQPWPGIEGVPLGQLYAQLHVTDGDGRLYGGSEAILRLLRDVPSLAWLGAIGSLPGLRAVSRLLYRLVARYRYRLFGRASDCSDGTCSLPVKKSEPGGDRS